MPTHIFVSSPAIQVPANGQKKTCAFCPLHEQPIVAGKNANVLAAAFPYTYKHVLIVPKKHASLSSTGKGTMAEICFFINALLTADNNLVVLANEGRLAGITQKHAHLHVLEPPGEDFMTARKAELEKSLADPLAWDLIDAAKFRHSEKYNFAAETEIDLTKPAKVLDAIKTAITELHATLRRHYETFLFMHEKDIASQHIDAYSKPFGDDIGFNFCMTLENNKTKLYIAPRLLLLKIVKEDGTPHRYSGNELFFNFTSERVGLDISAAGLWNWHEGIFHDWVKDTIKA